MRTKWAIERVAASGILTAGISVLLAGSAFAHCDTTGGPVIPEAKAALETGDITPVLKWVKIDDEPEIRAAFAAAIASQDKGIEVKEQAERHFLETLVRVHRTGEGSPYTGIKDEPVEPMVAMSDKAIADGSADELIAKMSGHMAAAVREKFEKVQETAKNKDQSVEAGREFVEAYVTYMHYVEGIHAAIMSAGGHHQHVGAEESDAPAVAEHKEHQD